MEELKTCPLLEFLNQHRKDCALKARELRFWYSSLDEVHSFKEKK